jgi:hypothetical protein
MYSNTVSVFLKKDYTLISNFECGHVKLAIVAANIISSDLVLLLRTYLETCQDYQMPNGKIGKKSNQYRALLMS